MKVTVDTNPLVRFIVRDDTSQAAEADRLLAQASLIAITLPCFCEFVWVLRSVYRLRKDDIITAVEALLGVASVETDVKAVEAGLHAMRTGADFADGVIAYEGRQFGGQIFVSFDREAVACIQAQGHEAKLL